MDTMDRDSSTDIDRVVESEQGEGWIYECSDFRFNEILCSMDVEIFIQTFAYLQGQLDDEQQLFDDLTARLTQINDVTGDEYAVTSRELENSRQRLELLMQRNLDCFEMSKTIVPIEADQITPTSVDPPPSTESEGSPSPISGGHHPNSSGTTAAKSTKSDRIAGFGQVKPVSESSSLVSRSRGLAESLRGRQTVDPPGQRPLKSCLKKSPAAEKQGEAPSGENSDNESLALSKDNVIIEKEEQKEATQQHPTDSSASESNVSSTSETIGSQNKDNPVPTKTVLRANSKDSEKISSTIFEQKNKDSSIQTKTVLRATSRESEKPSSEISEQSSEAGVTADVNANSRESKESVGIQISEAEGERFDFAAARSVFLKSNPLPAKPTPPKLSSVSSLAGTSANGSSRASTVSQVEDCKLSSKDSLNNINNNKYNNSSTLNNTMTSLEENSSRQTETSDTNGGDGLPSNMTANESLPPAYKMHLPTTADLTDDKPARKIIITNKRGDTSDLRWLNAVTNSSSGSPSLPSSPNPGGAEMTHNGAGNGIGNGISLQTDVKREESEINPASPSSVHTITSRTQFMVTNKNSASDDGSLIDSSEKATDTPPKKKIISLRSGSQPSVSASPTQTGSSAAPITISKAVFVETPKLPSNPPPSSTVSASHSGNTAEKPAVAKFSVTPKSISSSTDQSASTRSLMDEIQQFSLVSGRAQKMEQSTVGGDTAKVGVASGIQLNGSEKVSTSEHLAKLYLAEKEEERERESRLNEELESEDSVIKSSLGRWDPTKVLKRLYNVAVIQEPENNARYINMEGYMEKLPVSKTKDTLLKTWKRHLFRTNEGLLQYHEGHGDETVVETFQLSGGKVEEIGELTLGLEDGRGHFLVLKCPTQRDFENWLTALRSQVSEKSPNSWVQPYLTSPPSSTRKVLVLELGSCSIRAGMLGDFASLPQIFVPTVMATNKTTKEQRFCFDAWLPEVRECSVLSYPVRPTAKVDKYSIDWNVLPDLFAHVFQLLRVDPSKYYVMFSVPTNLTDIMKAQFMKIFFERFRVLGVNMQPQTILTLYSYDSTSGVVVDIGDRVEILPVTDGYVVEGGVARLAYGGQKVTEMFNGSLQERMYRFSTDVEFQIVRLAMEKLSYVSQNFLEECEKSEKDPEQFRAQLSIEEFGLPDGSWNEIVSGVERARGGEGLFDMSAWGMDNPSIQKLIQKAIQACPIDSRRSMWRNIYLSGGTTLLQGFAERLEAELSKLTPPSVTVQVHAAPNRYHASYIGACTLANKEEFQRGTITAEEWSREGVTALRKWTGI